MKLIKYFFILLLVFSKGALALVLLAGDQSLVFTGNEDEVYMFDSSSIDIQGGGNIHLLTAYNNSRVNIAGGDVNGIFAYENTVTNISGGHVGWLATYSESVTNIEFTTGLSWLFMNNNSVVNIFGSNFKYVNSRLSGNWSNGTPFSFSAIDSHFSPFDNTIPENIVLHEVPESLPIALMIIGLAGIFYRRKFGSYYVKC